MADNTVLNSGTGGDTIATDELTTLNGGVVSGVKAQRVKVGFGSDAVFRDVDASNGLPVVGAFFQTTQPVSGTVTANAGTGTMAVSLATAPTTPVTGTFFQTTQPVSGTVAISNMVAQGLTDTQLRLTPVPVSGTVSTGGLTDTQLRAAAVPVSGSFFQATQPVSGSFFQTTQPVSLATAPTTPVTGTFWQATQPVSLATLPVTNAGTFAVQAAATLAAETTKVIGTVNIATAQTVGLAAGAAVIGSVSLSAPLKTTYSASINNIVPALTPTDIFSITGSASKTIKIHSIQIDATATAAAVVAVFVVKRSTANTAGTSTAPTVVPLDSASATGTATVLAYTANPTLGTLVGNVRSEKLLVSTATTSGETLLINFGDSLGSPIVLRGVSQVLAFNLNAVSLTGGSVNCFVEWTEE